MAVDGVRVGVDFGTSSTAAVLAGPGTQTRPLLFDGSPLLPSAVFADAAGGLLTGRDALHSARTHPERFEPAPKRCVDHGVVLLGERSVPVIDLIASVLRRVAAEADLVAGERVRRAVLTHPVSWGPVRRHTLLAAATAAFAEPALVAEPVAAASYFLTVAGPRLPVGSCAMVYDLGAGTFDATVVRRSPYGFDVLATGGLDDVGGLDVDAAIVASLAEVYRGRDEAAWTRLAQPTTSADRRAARTFWDDVRAGKEMLSRASRALLHVPVVDEETVLSREQLDQLARPILERTVEVVPGVLAAAGVRPAELAGLFLVGGASRMPLVGTLLHQRLGVPPVLVDQPELVVASGSVRAPLPARGDLPPVAPVWAGPVAPAMTPITAVPIDFRPAGHRSGAEPAESAPVGPPPAESAPAERPANADLAEHPATSGPVEPSPVEPDPVRAESIEVQPVVGEPAAGSEVPSQQPVATAAARSGVPEWLGPPSGPAGQVSQPDVRPPALVPPPTAPPTSSSGRVLRLGLAAGLVVLLGIAGWFALPSNWPSAGPTDGPSTSGGTSSTLGSASPAGPAAPTPTVSQVPEHGQDRVHSLVLNSDGTRVAAISTYAIRTYALPDLKQVGKQLTVGKETYRVPGTSTVYREDFESAALSPDGRTVATYDGGIFGHVQVWDLTTGKRLQRLSDSWWASCLAFSPKKDRLAVCAGHDESVRFWTVSGWSRAGVVESDDPAAIVNVAFSPDGQLLAGDGGKGRVLMWDVRSRKRLGTLQASSVPSGMVPIQDPGVAVAFSPDGRTVVTGGLDGTVRLWNVGTRKQIAVLGQHGSRVVELAFARDGTLASGDADRQVRLWDMTARKQIGSTISLPGATSGDVDLAFTSDSRSLYTGLVNTVQRWDVASIRAYVPATSPTPSGSPTTEGSNQWRPR